MSVWWTVCFPFDNKLNTVTQRANTKVLGTAQGVSEIRPIFLVKAKDSGQYCPLSTLYTHTVGVPTTPYGNNTNADIRPHQRLSHYIEYW